MEHSTNSRAFSAPGKALLAGGYLVLDPIYKAYVVAVSSRIHSIVTTSNTHKKEGKVHVCVKSEQFGDKPWKYEIDKDDPSFVREIEGAQNNFVEAAILVVFSYFIEKIDKVSDITIEVYSDPAYHSDKGCSKRTNGVRTFNYFTSRIKDVPKTGLGSSASLTTSLVTSILSVFKPDMNLRSTEDLSLIHNLAQVAHCQAQNKVGSGFDVAAATFGSIRYRRFDPSLITKLPNLSESGLTTYSNALRTLINSDWDIISKPINLPSGFRLIMGDVNTGSETVKLVATVLKWYKENKEDGLRSYQTIDEGNNLFVKGLETLNSLSRKDENNYKKIINAVDHKQIENIDEISGIQNAILQVRETFRYITEQSGAQIEPLVQTKLLDACNSLDGVLTCMVPGAGGYDAIAVISTSDTDLDAITKGKEEFKNVNWLSLKQAETGIVEENVSSYFNLS